MSYFTQIRSSQGYPGTILDKAEPLFDYVNNTFYIGTEIGSAPIPFYQVSFDIVDGQDNYYSETDIFDAGNGYTENGIKITDGGSW